MEKGETKEGGRKGGERGERRKHLLQTVTYSFIEIG